LRSHEKGAPNGAYNRFFDPEMSLLRLGKIEVSYRPGESHIGDVCLVSKFAGQRPIGLEREAASSGSIYIPHHTPVPWRRGLLDIP